MPIKRCLLSEELSYKRSLGIGRLSSLQKDVAQYFLDNIHKNNRYKLITECPFCGENSFKQISEVDRNYLPYDVVICDHCHGCFKIKILDPEANSQFYDKISYKLRGKDISESAIEKLFFSRVKKFAYDRYYFISHLIKLDSEVDSIVEFGCNDGANLLPWKKNGFDIIGLDIDLRMINFGRKKGLNLVYGDLLNSDLSAKKPKLIILSHILEHVSDINKVLAKLSQLIHHEGYIFIELPGIRVQGISKPIFYLDHEHNYNFDLGSISRLLFKHGFKILYSDEYIRILCTLRKNQHRVVGKVISLSFYKIAATFINTILKKNNFNKQDLLTLLKKGAQGDYDIRLISKLQKLYFKFYYASIIEHEKKDVQR